MTADAPELNLKQVAASLGVHYMTAYRYVRQGRLAATRVGTEWRVSEAALDAFTRRGEERGGGGEEGPGPHGPGPHGPGPHGPGPRGTDWAGRLLPCLLAGDEPSAWRVMEAALASGHPLAYAYVQMLTPALTAIGSRWEAGELTVADQHVATAVASRLAARLGALVHRPGRSRGTVVFGAPSGERHSLPITVAADLVRLANFTVLELGADVPPEAFAVASQRAVRLVAVGVGVSSPDRFPAVQRTVDAIRSARPGVPIVIGGQAAITPAGAELRGVTAWAVDGPSAVALIERFAGFRA